MDILIAKNGWIKTDVKYPADARDIKLPEMLDKPAPMRVGDPLGGHSVRVKERFFTFIGHTPGGHRIFEEI